MFFFFINNRVFILSFVQNEIYIIVLDISSWKFFFSKNSFFLIIARALYPQIVDTPWRLCASLVVAPEMFFVVVVVVVVVAVVIIIDAPDRSPLPRTELPYLLASEDFSFCPDAAKD